MTGLSLKRLSYYMLRTSNKVAGMAIQYQLMARERGSDIFAEPRNFQGMNIEAAKLQAKEVFTTACRMRTADGQVGPKSVRILQSGVEMWRWDWPHMS